MEWCPVFRPTTEAFSDFAKYIDEVVEPEAQNIGICKVGVWIFFFIIH